MKTALPLVLALAGSLGTLPLLAAGPRTFTVDPAASRAMIEVGTAGAFSFAGHTHEVEAPLASGVVHVNSEMPSRSDGVTRPVTTLVALKVDGTALTATGKFTIKQSDFGIKPISIGGVVKVKDELALTFTVVARER